MKIFQCQNCGQIVFFENTYCVSCQSQLGFLPAEMTLLTLSTHDQGISNFANPEQQLKYCQNFQMGGCNWLLPADSKDCFCLACQLNNLIPDLSDEEHRLEWVRIEVAKHRLVYELLSLGLPVVGKNLDPETGLSFDFLSNDMMENGEQVMTGHMQGLITLNTDEADPVLRERIKAQMAEPYRTLIGHFRHEIGHYYWDLLVRPNANKLEMFRALFGDEGENYQEALNQHYQDGPPADWREQFVSAYASSHPWEDWAETWAHYLHLIATMQTAQSYGLGLQPALPSPSNRALSMDLTLNYDLLEHRDMEFILTDWLKLTLAVNSLNRSMGQSDLYPFVLPARVREKLQFIHQFIIAYRHREL